MTDASQTTFSDRDRTIAQCMSDYLDVLDAFALPLSNDQSQGNYAQAAEDMKALAGKLRPVLDRIDRL